MSVLIADIRYAARVLAKNPVFAGVAVLTLALGIGANTAIFTLLDQVLLRLLPVKNPQQLVLLTTPGRHYGNNWGANATSYPMYRDFQSHNEVFSGMFCRFPTRVSLTFGGSAARVAAELVSGTYFNVLGVGMALGRPFTAEEGRVPDGAPLVILSYNYWKQRFGGDPAILGKILTVNKHDMTIIGVAQAGFDGVELGYSPKLFIPVTMQHQVLIVPQDMLTDRRSCWVNAFGRLKPGISAKQAKASLQPFMHSMLDNEVREAAFAHASAYDREQFLKSTIDLLPGSQGRSYLRRQLSTPLWVLIAVTGTVLLIACANLANLLLARATGRQKEIAVRLAVGASRTRIVRQLLVETLSLSTLGGLVGLALAYGAVKALMALYLPEDYAGLSISATPDLRIFLFTLVVTVATGLIFGLVPAIRTTRPDISSTLKDQASAVLGGGHGGLRKTLVVAQVSLSLLLLIGAGLFLRTLNNLSSLGPGFRAEQLMGFNIDPSLSGYSPEQTKIFFQHLTDRLRTIPGVQSVGLAAMRILENIEWDSSMTVEGYNPASPKTAPSPT
jgi:predicted permease